MQMDGCNYALRAGSATCSAICFVLFAVVSVQSAEKTFAPTQIMMDANWKWEATTAPRWTSAFLGTNDIFGRDVDDVAKRLSTFRTEELEFVSVVGGLKYLQILGRVNFSRITFYDSNVNELTKLRLVHKRIMSLTYDEWINAGGLVGVNNDVVKRHDSFYLPHDLYEDGVTMVATADFQWPQSTRHLYQDPKGADARVGPMWTLNNPIQFPEYSWTPTRQEYDNVRYQLRADSIVNDKFYLKLPVAVTSPNRLAVVWCDGVQFPWGRIRMVSPVAMAIGLYANFSTRADWFKHDDLNQVWESPYFWWKTKTYLYFRGSFDRCLYLNSPEYAKSSFAYDYSYQNATILDDNIVEETLGDTSLSPRLNFGDYETLIFDNYMGSSSTSTDCHRRATFFQTWLEIAMNKVHVEKVKRIIITDHNKESDEWIKDALPGCAVTSNGLIDIVNAAIQNAKSGFRISDSSPLFLPGAKAYDRNTMIIVDNAKFDTEFDPTGTEIGIGGDMKEDLDNVNAWFESAVTVQGLIFRSEEMGRVCFYPRNAKSKRVVSLFVLTFCEEYGLDKGDCSMLVDVAMDERNYIKVNQLMYPLF